MSDDKQATTDPVKEYGCPFCTMPDGKHEFECPYDPSWVRPVWSTDKIENGELYWTILPDMESAGYGDDRAREPYLVRAGLQTDGVVYLYSYDSDTGKIDTDDNATVLCGSFFDGDGVFETLEEAKKGYRKAVVKEIQVHLDKVIELSMVLLGEEE